MELLRPAEAPLSGPDSTDDLVQALLLRRLAEDPALHDLLPLLGLPSPAVVPDVGPSPTRAGARDDPIAAGESSLSDRRAVEQAVTEAAAALASCQALLGEVAAALNACVDLTTASALPSRAQADTKHDITHQHESGRSG
jgi:hypothetical protein